jgi:hypothetical protein
MTQVRTILTLVAIVLTALLLFQVFKYAMTPKDERSGRDPLTLLAALAVLNWLAFSLVESLAGGNALSGKIVGDQYFIANHARYRPVSFGFWLYSLTHAWVTILSCSAAAMGQFFGIVSGRLDIRRAADKRPPRERGTV